MPFPAEPIYEAAKTFLNNGSHQCPWDGWVNGIVNLMVEFVGEHKRKVFLRLMAPHIKT